MRYQKFSLRILAATIGLAGSAVAHADLFVIANPATQITASEIKEIFTGEKQIAGSVKLVPVDNGPVQEAFLDTALRMDAPRYNTIWTKKSFREGIIPPTVKSGDNDVIEFVRRTPGAVGYISSNPPNGVTVVRKY